MKKFFQGLLADVTPSRTSLFGKVFWGFIGLFVTLKPEVADNSAPAKKIDPEVVEQEITTIGDLIRSAQLAQKNLEPDYSLEEKAQDIIDAGDLSCAYEIVTNHIGDDNLGEDNAAADLRRETGLSPFHCKELIKLARDYDPLAA